MQPIYISTVKHSDTIYDNSGVYAASDSRARTCATVKMLAEDLQDKKKLLQKELNSGCPNMKRIERLHEIINNLTCTLARQTVVKTI